MKAVDFIIEFPYSYLFVEIKDPTSPEEYQKRLARRDLDESLKYKFRDSFIYEWASGRANKPIDYYILITEMDKDLLLRVSNHLREQIPVLEPGEEPWTKTLVNRFGVFNMDTWNAHLPDYPVSRVSIARS